MEKHGIRYKKIKANFGDRSPSTEAVEAFIETVNEFMRDDEEGEAEIAVVCTYGTNREFQISLEMWFMILSIQTDLRSLSLMILYYHDFYKQERVPDMSPPNGDARNGSGRRHRPTRVGQGRGL